MEATANKIDFKKLRGVIPKDKKINERNIRPWFKKDKTDNLALLRLAQDHWDSLEDFRSRRVRSRKYLRGDQWHELIDDPDNPGETISEETYIKRQGKVPLKQNLIRQLVKNLEGQHRMNPTQTMVVTRNRETQVEGEIMSNVLRAAKDLNRAKKLDAANWREYVLSGLPVRKTGFKFWHERDQEDLFLENVIPNKMFWNTDVSDPRLIDLNLIGELRDTDLDEIISAFGANEDEAAVIKNWYRNKDVNNTIVAHAGASPDRVDSLDFGIEPIDKCRVIEIWQLKSEWRIYAHDYADGTYQFVDYTMEEIAAITQARIVDR